MRSSIFPETRPEKKAIALAPGGPDSVVRDSCFRPASNTGGI
jgi:hypothetical protein